MADLEKKLLNTGLKAGKIAAKSAVKLVMHLIGAKVFLIAGIIAIAIILLAMFWQIVRRGDQNVIVQTTETAFSAPANAGNNSSQPPGEKGYQFYQNKPDSPYKDALYGGGKTFESAGCGPTAMAMIISDLTGQEVNPVEAWGWTNRSLCYISGSKLGILYSCS